MLTVLTIAVVFIALLLAVVHWSTVREGLLWCAAIINVLSWLFGLLALFGAVLVFLWAAISRDASLGALGITLALVFVSCLVVAGVLSFVEVRDRERQFAKFRSWASAAYSKNSSETPSDPSDRGAS